MNVIPDKHFNQGVGRTMAMLWAIENHDPAVTAPPYTDDWMTAAKEPATGPVAAKPITPTAPTASEVKNPIFYFVINLFDGFD